MVKRGSETSEKKPDEEDQIRPTLPRINKSRVSLAGAGEQEDHAPKPDHREREVGRDIPEIGKSQDGSIVSEIMVRRRLCHRERMLDLQSHDK